MSGGGYNGCAYALVTAPFLEPRLPANHGSSLFEVELFFVDLYFDVSDPQQFSC